MSKKYGFNIWIILLISILFVPTMLIFYNTDVYKRQGLHSCINFYDFAVMWLNYKKEYVNPSSGKTISPKLWKHMRTH